jgi:hypothetical protein
VFHSLSLPPLFKPVAECSTEWIFCGFEGFTKTFLLHPKNFYLLKSLLNAQISFSSEK